MFKRILVPLDGSPLAEQALLPASRIADRFDSSLLLLRVVTPDRPLPGFSPVTLRPAAEPVGGTHPPLVAEAEAYLSGLRLPVPCLRVQTQVLAGAPPELIIATATESGADLIVMSTHGRDGLLRLLYGSVAEAVLRGATVPVLLVPSRVIVRVHIEKPPVTLPQPR
jgi:nucleotide-binding universal stress UspA family protein